MKRTIEWTAKNVVKSTVPLPPWASTTTTFSEHVMRTNLPHGGFASQAANPNAIAVVEGLSNTKRTYQELASDVPSVASAFRSMGVKKGDVVTLVSPNTVDYFSVLHGAAVAGAIVSPVNPTAPGSDVAKQMKAAGSTFLVGHPCCMDHVLDAAKEVSACKVIIALDGDGENEDKIPSSMTRFSSMRAKKLLSAKELANVSLRPVEGVDRERDILLLPFSSGTTGFPKGVMLSNANVAANLDQAYDSEARFFEGPLMSPLPQFHIYGYLVSLNLGLHHGKTLLTLKRFDLDLFCKMVQEYRPTRAHVVPPIILGLGKSPIVDKYDLSSLKMLLSAAAPLGAAVQEQCSKRLKVKIKQGWGMSELSPLATVVSDDAPMDLAVGSSGPPCPGTELKVVDEKGQALPPGQEGELLVRGPQVMLGYLNASDKTKESIEPDGFLKSGDLAVINQDGYITIKDRQKELIKYKGLQVAPAVLEALLVSHASILDAIVIPKLDDEAGEIPRAYVVVREGHKVDASELVEWAASQTAHYYKLRGGVVFVKSLPKTTSGKLLRHQVIQMDRAAT